MLSEWNCSWSSFAVDETKHGKVYLLTGEGCVVAMWIGRRRGSVDEGLRRRRRRPVLVGCRSVRVMRCVVRRVMAKAACTTQQKTAVARRCRHIVMMVLVNGSEKNSQFVVEMYIAKYIRSLENGARVFGSEV